MKAAIYARISKERCNACGHGKEQHGRTGKRRCKVPGCRKCGPSGYQGQDPESQLLQLRQYAAAQGWGTVEYVDMESGSHAERPQLQELFAAATRREFNVVLVWALDRFTREGVLETFVHIKKLLDYGVQFESFTEAHFRTTGGVGEIMIAIAAWIAKQERIRISERTKAGLARARANGQRLGKPKRVFRRDLAEEMRAAGKSWAQIADELEVPRSTVRDQLAGVRISPSPKRGLNKGKAPVS